MQRGKGKRVTLPPRMGADGKPNPKGNWETFNSMGEALRARPEMTRLQLISWIRKGKAILPDEATA